MQIASDPYLLDRRCRCCGADVLDKNRTQKHPAFRGDSVATILYECGCEDAIWWQESGIVKIELMYPCPETGKLPQ